MLYNLDFFFACHRGKIRKTNQDNFVCGQDYLPPDHESITAPALKSFLPEAPFLLAVFDGMSGEARGEMASWIAADTFHNWNLQRGETSLTEGCLESNRRIAQYAQRHRLKSCGTTAAMLLFDSAGIVRCDIGDSRIYRIRNNIPELLSEADVFPAAGQRKHYLLQHLGIPESEMAIQPHTERYGAVDGDVYLICSDGLSDVVPEEKITGIVRNTTIEKAGRGLLRSALDAGGPDNITFFLVRIRKNE